MTFAVFCQLQPGIEVLPLPLGIVDVPFLVSEASFCLFDLFSLLLYLIGENRDIGVVKPFLDLINPSGNFIDCFRGFVKFCLEGCQFRGAIPCFFLLTGDCCINGLLFNGDRIEPRENSPVNIPKRAIFWSISLRAARRESTSAVIL